MARTRIRWRGAEIRSEARRKVSKKLDMAAKVVQAKTKELLSTPGHGKRAKAGRMVKAWMSEARLAKTKTPMSAVLAQRKRYKLGRGGKLNVKLEFHSGKMQRTRKGSKVLGLFRASRGNPPLRQTGKLRQSIRVTKRTQLVRRIGTHIFYGKILEPSHPFLVPALEISKGMIAGMF